MTLFATMTFDDEDPELHAHFTGYAHGLDAGRPREFARVLTVLADALTEYAARVTDVAERAVVRMDAAEAPDPEDGGSRGQ